MEREKINLDNKLDVLQFFLPFLFDMLNIWFSKTALESFNFSFLKTYVSYISYHTNEGKYEVYIYTKYNVSLKNNVVYSFHSYICTLNVSVCLCCKRNVEWILCWHKYLEMGRD